MCENLCMECGKPVFDDKWELIDQIVEVVYDRGGFPNAELIGRFCSENCFGRWCAKLITGHQCIGKLTNEEIFNISKAVKEEQSKRIRENALNNLSEIIHFWETKDFPSSPDEEEDILENQLSKIMENNQKYKETMKQWVKQ